MDNNHIIKANRTALGHFRTRPAFQYDYGQVLMLSGFTLPQAFEVHFSIGNGKSITMIGSDDQVQIPDECLRNAGTLTAWLYLHDTESDGETRFVIEIPVEARAEITNQEPTPVQQDVITQAIAALNTGVVAAQTAQEAAQSAQEAAETAQAEAEAAAESVKNADATAETLEPGSQATVVVEDVGGVKTFHFGLVKGDKGDQGEQGIRGVPGQDGYTPQKGIDYFDGKPGYTPIKGVDYFDGEPGAPGEPGNDGFSPSINVSEITGGHKVTVTNKTGSSSFDVMDGLPGGKGDPGDPGTPGQDGVSPTISVADITGGHRITITDKTGTRSVDVMDGVEGDKGDTGDSGVYYGSATPTDPDVNVWIDPTGTSVIDDTAGDGDTNKVWSADKTASEIDSVNGAFIDDTDTVQIPKGSSELTIYADHGYINQNNGIFYSNDGYDVYLYDIVSDGVCYISHDSADSKLVGIVLYSEHLNFLPTTTGEASSVYVRGTRSSDGVLPDAENPWQTTSGQMIAIFVQQRNSSGSVVYDNNFVLSVGVTVKKLNNNILLNTVQIKQVNKKPFISYDSVESEVGSTGKQQLSIYIPATTGYIKYAFIKQELNSKNYNVWRIYKAYACDEDKNIRYSITAGGEWEMAIKIKDRSDFIGGASHGDEVFNAFTVFVDGKIVSDITSLATEFDTLQLIETSDLYDPNDGATLETKDQFSVIGTHGREYLFTSNGLRLLQDVRFVNSYILGPSYMTMLPIIRGNDAVSQAQITDHYFANSNNVIYDVSVGASGSAGYGWKPDITKAMIYGTTSGVSADVEMLKQPNVDNAGARLFQVQDTVDQYNKLYWSICGVGNVFYTTAADERFATDTIFKIDAAT